MSIDLGQSSKMYNKKSKKAKAQSKPSSCKIKNDNTIFISIIYANSKFYFAGLLFYNILQQMKVEN